ncbi:MAG: type I methionyl aminopeptidase [Armatimonadota bacterium]
MIILKTKREIEKIASSGRITARVIEEIGKRLKEGISTEELDIIAEKIIIESGAIPSFKGYRGFPKTITVSINEEVVHGIPSPERIIKKGSIVGIDVGVLLDGFHSDAAYTFIVGDVPQEHKKLVDVTREALGKAIEKCVIGARLSDIGNAVQEHVESHGYSPVRDLVGHGIGRNMHEDPQIPNFGAPGLGQVMEEGMVFAIEPMINLGGYEIDILKDGWTVVTKDRSMSAHFEHTVAVTKEGPRILTGRSYG